jgi:photosystem II stability/assembly factor-like uncharacterized protein
MLRLWATRMVLAIGLLAVLVLPGHAESQWASIGPLSPHEIRDVVLAPDWPHDRSMLAIRGIGSGGADLVRSRNGGETWQRLPFPEPYFGSNNGWLARTPVGRVTFFGNSVYQRGTTKTEATLYRSVDNADTWEQVWQGGAFNTRMLISPTFADDTTIYLQADRLLLRSRDAGKTWVQVKPVGEAGIDAMAFSPTYSTDHTMVAGVAAVLANDSPLPNVPPGDPSPTSGLILSTDGGETWVPLPTPSRDGVQYPRATKIVLSPSFAEDHTLYVLASDRWPETSETVRAASAIFRSVDRGLTWETILPSVTMQSTIALSPSFAQDRTVLFEQRLDVPGQPDGRCVVRRSADAGSTWGAEQSLADRRRCPSLGLWQGPNGIVAVGALAMSTDLGETWQPLAPPDEAWLGYPVVSPNFVQDGTFYFASQKHGVLAFGPGVQPATGLLRCDVPLADGLSPFFDAQPDILETLGCPKGPVSSATFTEQLVTIDGRLYRDLWRDSLEVRFRLPEDAARTGDSGSWIGEINTNLPDAPDRVVAGLRQEFDFGNAYVIFGSDHRPKEALFLSGAMPRGRYRAYTIPE